MEEAAADGDEKQDLESIEDETVVDAGNEAPLVDEIWRRRLRRRVL